MVYYRTWRRIDPKTHELIGRGYAGASIITLLVINGISPGAATQPPRADHAAASTPRAS